MSVVIETTLGDITVDLYLKERPNTCLNFLKLCKIKFYNLCLFHKIERNFIAQTGDPTGTGRGGESVFCHLYGDQAKYFDIETKPRLKHEKRGTLSMVNNGNNMNGSQFFITLGDNLTYLDDDHSVFGEVTEGFDILLKLNEAICDENNRPYQDVRITHTVVLHDPFDDPANLIIPDASPEPTKEQLESNYIGADEEIDDTKGKSMEEIDEKIKESEAKARATILEMVGDIPDADVKPPENVLFVCKLNPVTTSEDLEIIFSRFGTIVSCEVIKDKKTSESLQYAFIEFEKEEDCENAYFKMDNVLIDDRRIHVDFSQSVSKMNLEMQSKFKRQSGKSQTLVIKNQTKSSDGYDMIFDMEDDSNRASKAEIKQHHSSRTNKDSSKYNNRDKSSKRSQPSEQRYIEQRRGKRQSNSPVPRRSSQNSKYDTTDYESRQYSSAYSRSREEEYRYDKTNYGNSHRRKRSFSPDPVRSSEKRFNSPKKYPRRRDEYSSSPEQSRVNERPATDKHRRDRENSYGVEVSRSHKLSPRPVSHRSDRESKRKLEKNYSHETITKRHSKTHSDRSVSPRGHSSSKRKAPTSKNCTSSSDTDSSSDSDSSSSSSSSDNVKRQTSVQRRRKQEKYSSLPKSKSRSPSEVRQNMKKNSSYSKSRRYSSSPEVLERENKSKRVDDYGSKSSHSKKHKSGSKRSEVSHDTKGSYRVDDGRDFQSKKHKSRRSSS